MSDFLGPANAAFAVTTRPAETRTFGTLDTFFTDCSSPAAADGTDVSAAFLNEVLVNLRGIARLNGTTVAGGLVNAEDNADAMVARAIRHALQRGKPMRAVDTGGGANAIVVAFDPVPAELSDGMDLFVKVAADNTGATNIAINGGLYNGPLYTAAGNACVGGEVKAGRWAHLRVNVTGSTTTVRCAGLTGADVIMPTPGASTVKAPKLIGVNLAGSGTNMATSTNTQLVMTPVKNNLIGTSAWSNATNTLTIGAGEAGLLLVIAGCWFVPAAAAFQSVTIRVNGSQIDLPGTSNPGSGNGGAAIIADVVPTVVGDQVTFWAYQQSGSTYNSQGQFARAYLISSY